MDKVEMRDAPMKHCHRPQDEIGRVLRAEERVVLAPRNRSLTSWLRPKQGPLEAARCPPPHKNHLVHCGNQQGRCSCEEVAPELCSVNGGFLKFVSCKTLPEWAAVAVVNPIPDTRDEQHEEEVTKENLGHPAARRKIPAVGSSLHVNSVGVTEHSKANLGKGCELHTKPISKRIVIRPELPTREIALHVDFFSLLCSRVQQLNTANPISYRELIVIEGHLERQVAVVLLYNGTCSAPNPDRLAHIRTFLLWSLKLCHPEEVAQWPEDARHWHQAAAEPRRECGRHATHFSCRREAVN
mmetsp:Transcript_81538/g.144415  ORF Transcript_81538/g.144415 Transcript_81538/m.144415 type:complete len:298 (+) Transcript_81538:119-1012(+)